MGSGTREVDYISREINKILIKYDLEALIRMGAPQDEYFSEAWLIGCRLNNLEKDKLRLSDILEVLVDVYRAQFGWKKVDFNNLEPRYKHKIFMATFEISLVLENNCEE